MERKTGDMHNNFYQRRFKREKAFNKTQHFQCKRKWANFDTFSFLVTIVGQFIVSLSLEIQNLIFSIESKIKGKLI